MELLDDFRRFELQSEEDIEDFIKIFIRSDPADLKKVEDPDAYPDFDEDKWMEEKTAGEAEKTKTATILRQLLNRILNNCRPDCSGCKNYDKYDECNKRLYILWSPNYTDRYYRDLYSMYYSYKFFTVPKTCMRFFLFDGSLLESDVFKAAVKDRRAELNDAFIGTIVRRPIPGSEIGRTLIDPRYLFDIKKEDENRLEIRKKGELTCNIWINQYRMTMKGIPLSVWAFPFTMQDGEVETCAETTIQNLTDYYSCRYPDYKVVLPSEIAQIIRENSDTRSLPSSGLTYDMISHVFMELGYSPVVYLADMYQRRMAELLHSYVASAVPVALGIANRQNPKILHSLIVIGTKFRFIDSSQKARTDAFDDARIVRIPDKGQKKSFYFALKGAVDNTYIVMDDGKSPYSEAEIFQDEDGKLCLKYKNGDGNPDEIWEVETFMAPVSSEMGVDADAAINYFRSLISDQNIGFPNYIDRATTGAEITSKDRDFLYGGMLKDGEYRKEKCPLVTRIFLCQSKRLKEQRRRTFKESGNEELLHALQNTHMPRFVWVCELYSKASYTLPDAPECIGEIVMDATTGSVSPEGERIGNVIWINYPWLHVARAPEQDENVILEAFLPDSNLNKKEYKLIVPYKFERH